MRVFAIGLVVVTFSAFIAFAVVMSKVRFGPVVSPEPDPHLEGLMEGLNITVASGWDVITGRQVAGAIRDETGTCADPYDAMPELTHAGRTGVTLQVRPQPGRRLVINAVRVRADVTTPPARETTYLYHCAGPAGAPATRVRIDPSRETSYPVEGPFPQQVPAEGYRQDIEVELHGEKPAHWRVEVDYTLDDVSATFTPPFQGLTTEPVPTAATAHWVWCDRQWRSGERC
jgi:hypothetical protein